MIAIPPPAGGTPPIFADLVLDTGDGRIILNVERTEWLEKARELQPQTERVGLVMRGTDEIKAWLETDGKPFEYFSRVTGRISLAGHVQERKACIRCDGVEVWLDRNGRVA